MSKLLLLTIIFIGAISCTPKVKQVEDSKKTTTVYLQELPKDSVTMSIQGNIVYIFNEENEVIYKLNYIGDDCVITPILYLIINLIVVLALLLAIVVHYIIKD